MAKFTCRNLHYNATTSAFEACVDFVTGGATLRFPCQVRGPMTMDMDVVKAGLQRHAKQQSRRGASLMSRF